MKGQMCLERDIYHSQEINEKNMGQMHYKRNVCQNTCPNIEDYDTIYGDRQMCAYNDRNCVGNMGDHKSTSCYVFLLGNGTINWNNKKQTSIVVLST
jgi:hypothetical protein